MTYSTIRSIVYGVFIRLKRPFKTYHQFLTIFLLLISISAFGQQSKESVERIYGIVKDESGKGIAGATIQIKGKTNKVITNNDGQFEVTVPVGSTLIISSLGYERKEVKEKNEINVTLNRDVAALDEAVVIGYGTTSRRFNTGSTLQINAKEIENQPVANPLSALQGRTPGVLITTSNGVPGADIAVQIRGKGSIGSGTNPLYIIDGVPVPSAPISNVASASGNISPLSTINPSDIENISILKDADATAIYGSRGSNGVVIITTKQGIAGKTKIDFDIYTGSQKVTRKMKMLETPEYLELRKAAFAIDNITPTTANAPDLLLWDQNVNNDWQKILIGNNAPVTNAQLNISGGDERTRFFVGAGYRYEGAVLIGDNYNKRGNLNVNIQHNSADKRFNFNTTVLYANDNISTNGLNPYSFINYPPNFPLYNENGKPYYIPGVSLYNNPISNLFSTTETKSYNFVGNSILSYRLIDRLELKTTLSYSRLNMDQLGKYRTGYVNPAANLNYTNYALYGNSYAQNYSIEPQVNYGVSIGKGELSALLGATLQHTSSANQYIRGNNYSSDALLGSVAAAGVIASRTNGYSEYKFSSVFARLNYNWNSKYILNGTFRRDGSSRFSPGNAFGDFWAIAGGWIFSQENFVKDALPFLSFGKLRGSYGVTGNDQIGDYQYLQTFSSTTNPYDGQTGLNPTRLANDNYQWETTKKLDIGLELGFFNNRLNLTADYYDNRSGNQLVRYPLASQAGFSSYQANLPALIKNNGLELSLSSNNISKGDFQWKSTFNITVPHNKLLKFPGLESSSYASTYQVGKSLNAWFYYDYTGIDPQTGHPTIRDVNKDGNYTYADDYVYVGANEPKFYGGFGNTFSYKGLDLDLFFQFQKKPTDRGFLWIYYKPVGLMYNTKEEYGRDYWTTPGQDATRPRLTADPASSLYTHYALHYSYSSGMMSDASFIRLKNVALSYHLPKRWVESVRLRDVKFYALAQNLLTFTKFDALDPETGLNTPPLRTITFGVHISL